MYLFSSPLGHHGHTNLSSKSQNEPLTRRHIVCVCVCVCRALVVNVPLLLLVPISCIITLEKRRLISFKSPVKIKWTSARKKIQIAGFKHFSGNKLRSNESNQRVMHRS